MTETKNCRRCTEDYEPKYRLANSRSFERIETVRVLIGNGYCPDCVPLIIKEMDAKEEAARLAFIAKQRRSARMATGIPPRFMGKDFSNFYCKGRGKQIESA